MMLSGNRSFLSFIIPMIMLAMCALLTSCGSMGVKFDPDFHVPSLAEQALVNERGERIYFLDSKIENFGCMSEDKIKELRGLLLRAKQIKAKSSKEKQGKKNINATVTKLDKALEMIKSNRGD